MSLKKTIANLEIKTLDEQGVEGSSTYPLAVFDTHVLIKESEDTVEDKTLQQALYSVDDAAGKDHETFPEVSVKQAFENAASERAVLQSSVTNLSSNLNTAQNDIGILTDTLEITTSELQNKIDDIDKQQSATKKVVDSVIQTSDHHNSIFIGHKFSGYEPQNMTLIQNGVPYFQGYDDYGAAMTASNESGADAYVYVGRNGCIDIGASDTLTTYIQGGLLLTGSEVEVTGHGPVSMHADDTLTLSGYSGLELRTPKNCMIKATDVTNVGNVYQNAKIKLYSDDGLVLAGALNKANTATSFIQIGNVNQDKIEIVSSDIEVKGNLYKQDWVTSWASLDDRYIPTKGQIDIRLNNIIDNIPGATPQRVGMLYFAEQSNEQLNNMFTGTTGVYPYSPSTNNAYEWSLFLENIVPMAMNVETTGLTMVSAHRNHKMQVLHYHYYVPEDVSDDRSDASSGYCQYREQFLGTLPTYACWTHNLIVATPKGLRNIAIIFQYHYSSFTGDLSNNLPKPDGGTRVKVVISGI